MPRHRHMRKGSGSPAQWDPGAAVWPPLSLEAQGCSKGTGLGRGGVPAWLSMLQPWGRLPPLKQGEGSKRQWMRGELPSFTPGLITILSPPLSPCHLHCHQQQLYHSRDFGVFLVWVLHRPLEAHHPIQFPPPSTEDGNPRHSGEAGAPLAQGHPERTKLSWSGLQRLPQASLAPACRDGPGGQVSVSRCRAPGAEL